MPEQSGSTQALVASEAKEASNGNGSSAPPPVASTEKAVAKVKIDLKSTKVNKKSVDFISNNNNNNESVNNQNHQIRINSPITTVSKSEQNSASAETSGRDLSQVSFATDFYIKPLITFKV